MVQLPPPLVTDGLRFLQRRQFPELQRDDLVDGAQPGAGIALHRLPRPEQDIGNDPHGPPLFPPPDVGADVGGHLDHFGAQNHSGPVLGVPAIHLVTDPVDGIDVSATGLQEDGQPTQAVFDQVAGRTGKIGGDQRRAGPHGHRVAAVAEAGGDGLAGKIVDPEDTHGRVDGYAGILSQHVPSVGTGLPTVDADMGFTPTGPDPGRLQRPVGCRARLHQPLDELFLVGPLQPHLPGRVGQEIGEGRTAVGMVEIDQDMGSRSSHRLADAAPDLESDRAERWCRCRCRR